MNQTELQQIQAATKLLRLIAEGIRRAPGPVPAPLAEAARAMRPIRPDEALAYAQQMAAHPSWHAFARAVKAAESFVQLINSTVNTGRQP